jgi:hypothetical protein
MRDGKHPIKSHPTLAALWFADKKRKPLDQIAGYDELQRRELHPLQICGSVELLMR